MSVPQITVRLPPQLKRQFGSYARRVGISTSEFAKLLILRERNLKRLSALYDARELPRRTRRTRGESLQPEKITAHFPSMKEIKIFDRYAKSCDLNRNLAGAWLIKTELKEKWLEAALSR